jgi:signal peptidase I
MDASETIAAEAALRKPWLAGLLGLLFPGLGHLYVGRATQGLVLVGAYFGLFITLIAAGFRQTLWGELAILGDCIAFLLLAIIQPTITAFRQPIQVQRRYMRWPVYLVYAVAVAVIGWSLPPALLSHSKGAIFSVPSQSMSPTLVPGDIIVIDRRAYVGRLPARNDLVVIRVPTPGSRGGEIEYVRRVKSVVSDPTSVSPSLELAPDNPVFEIPELKVLPTTQVTGRVTRILWSHDFGRIGRRFQ